MVFPLDGEKPPGRDAEAAAPIGTIQHNAKRLN